MQPCLKPLLLDFLLYELINSLFFPFHSGLLQPKEHLAGIFFQPSDKFSEIEHYVLSVSALPRDHGTKGWGSGVS